jgi:hypothetical protein
MRGGLHCRSRYSPPRYRNSNPQSTTILTRSRTLT